MKKDLRPKHRDGLIVARKQAKDQLVELLKLTQELETVYETYPKLRSVVGENAWHSLTDVVYQQLLGLNLEPTNQAIRKGVLKNIERLEDISAASLIRDETGLRDILSRVLTFRFANNLLTK